MPTTAPRTDYVQQLRRETAAVRLMHSKFGVRRALSKQQIKDAAETFEANGSYLTASKKLINTKHTAYSGCTKIISQARGYWRTMTVPFPIEGIRLLRKDLVPVLDQQLRQFRTDLTSAVAALTLVYGTLRTEARDQLGTLFNPADYPTDISDLFRIDWDYPSVEPPDYLKQLNPKLYEQELQRVGERFEAAIRLAEDAFAGELQQLVAHLVDRLRGESDGKPKVFRDSAVKSISEFFERFKAMKIGGNTELDQLVERAEQIVGGVDPADLRKDRGMREQLATQMAEVQQALDSMVVDQPVRAIELPEDDPEDEPAVETTAAATEE